MKKFDFPAYTNYGKGDSGETVVIVELTDEEAERLIGAAEKGDYFHMNECEAISDIHDKVYAAAVKQITEEFRECDRCEEAKDENWKADELYPIGVNFPEELQNRNSD